MIRDHATEAKYRVKKYGNMTKNVKNKDKQLKKEKKANLIDNYVMAFMIGLMTGLIIAVLLYEGQ